MEYIVSGSDIKKVDEYAIKRLGIPSMVLMERAALSVVDLILCNEPKDKKILVRVPALRTAFTVADGCETVYFSAFMNTAYVDDDFTFYLCDKLTNLTLPKSVKVFEDNKKFASDYSASKDFQKITIKWDGASEEQIKNIMEKIERK